MKVVIDIPESRYEECLAWCKKGKFNVHPLELAVANGIPLPKGHGDLIDRDTLNLDYEVSMADDWKTAHEIANCVKYAPTVIPANKGD